MAKAGLGYFKGIDGLRSLAVLTVMVFHLHKQFLPGGYIGVDIFFVISGFVVTASVAHLQFKSLWDFQTFFYARRIKRIVPALLACMLATTIAVVLFVPESWLGRSIYQVGVYGIFGASNIALIRQQDTYFAPASEFNPFLHTWSLGVEEQFYFIYPILMYFVLRTAGRHRLAVPAMVALTLLSFGLCALATLSGYWKIAFYSIPTRYWELGIGTILCLTIDRWRSAVATAPAMLTAAGFILSLAIIAGSLTIEASERFPFPLALLPAIGSCGLIAVLVARPDLALAAPFTSAVAVYIGRISYSLYLWHWPVYVLMRWTIGLSDAAHYLIAVALTFVLAILSYHFVEMPFRHSEKIRGMRRRSVIGIGLATVIVATFGAKAVFAAQDRLSLSTTAAHRADWYPSPESFPPTSGGCGLRTTSEAFEGGTKALFEPVGCRAVAGKLIVAGDSHALAYMGLLQQYVRQTGRSVVLYFRTNCAFLLPPDPTENEELCSPYPQKLTDALARDLKAGDVLFLPSFRLHRLLDATGIIGSAAIEPDDVTRNYAPLLRQTTADLRRITANGGRVVFEMPKPVFRTLPFRCSDWFNHDNPDCRAGMTMSRDEILRFRQPMAERMHLLSRAIPKVGLWDPLPLLCPGAQCSAMRDGHPLYFDADHISGYSNRLLYAPFSKRMAREFHDVGSPA